MKIPHFFQRCGVLLLFAALGAAVAVQAQTAALTYQGRLSDGGNNAPTATYDIKFDLYDADVEGNLIATVTNSSVFVNGGVFSVSLNFASASFDGGERYLEISVRPAGTSVARTVLTPRQRITSAPYAVQSRKATTAVSFSGNLNGDVTGTQTATVVSTVGGETAANVASGAQIANAATSANTPGAVVQRNASGNFAAGNITAGNVILAPGGKVTFADGTQQQTSVDPALFVTRNVLSGSINVMDNRLTVQPIAPTTGGPTFRVVSPTDNPTSLGGVIAQFRSNLGNNGPVVDKFRIDQAGGFVAIGQIGYGIIPATGEGVRFMWYPSKGATRFGAASAAGEFDDANVGFYSFAGGSRTIANSFASFAFGDQVVVTGSGAVGFGRSSTIEGDSGFGSGSSNKCIGFVCTAMGFNAIADGQSAFALGFKVSAVGDYSYVFGRHGRTGCNTGETDCTTAFSRSGSFVFADGSTTSYLDATANNQFNVRATGGIRLRTSIPTSGNVGVSGNTGCDLPGNSGVMTCASSRLVKENYAFVNGEDVLRKIRRMPIMKWNYIGEEAGESHIGPFAEDFQGAFRLSKNDRAIGAQDLSGVSLVGVQALEVRTEKLQKENSALKAEVNQLQQELKAQQNLLEAVKKLLCAEKPEAEICRQ